MEWFCLLVVRSHLPASSLFRCWAILTSHFYPMYNVQLEVQHRKTEHPSNQKQSRTAFIILTNRNSWSWSHHCLTEFFFSTNSHSTSSCSSDWLGGGRRSSKHHQTSTCHTHIQHWLCSGNFAFLWWQFGNVRWWMERRMTAVAGACR